MPNQISQKGYTVPKKSAPLPDIKLELSEHLPYLFRHIYAQLEAASAGRLAQFGVNVATWRILAVLWQHGELAHRELADLTSIEVSTLSRVSKSVQQDGLIQRTRTESDQRTVRVTLTDKGRLLAQQIIPSAHWMQSKMAGDLTREELQTLTRILQIIVVNLGTYGETDSDLSVASPKVNGTAVSAAAVPANNGARPVTTAKRRKSVPAAAKSAPKAVPGRAR